MNVTEDCILTINENNAKSEVITNEKVVSTHFIPAFIGNGTDHMNINLINLSESGVVEGDEIGIFDGITCVGSARITNQALIVDRKSLSIPVSANDGIENKNGYTDRNQIDLKLFREGVEYALTIETQNNSNTDLKKEARCLQKLMMI